MATSSREIHLADVCRKFREEALVRQERLTRFWNGEDMGRNPVAIVPFQWSPRQIYDNPALQMERMARYIERGLSLPGDFIPTFWPDQGTLALASAFGGKILSEGTEGSHRWIEPVLSSWDEVDRLTPPDPIGGVVKTEFDLCRRFFEESGELWWVTPPDMQGPVNMACQLMDTSEFLTGLYTDPERARKLLRMCADVIISVLDAYRTEFGDALQLVTWPHIWLPPGRGVTLTQDSIPTLSPSLYEEFEAPLVKEIADHFGGIYIHCCGRFEHVLPSLAAFRNLMGVDHAYPESHAENILAALGTGIVITSNVTTRGEQEFPTRDRYLAYLLPRLPAGARLWTILADDQPEAVLRALDLLGLSDLRDRYTPETDGT